MEILHENLRSCKGKGEAIRLPTGQIVGTLLDKTARFPVRHSKHFFRIMSSWTIDVGVIAGLRGLADVIFIEDRERGETWSASYPDFIRLAKRTENRSGVKLALHSSHWQLVHRESRAEQLDFFPQPGTGPHLMGIGGHF